MKIAKAQKVDAMNEAIEALESGGVIAYPTETSYGLACDMTNASAVERIYQIKGRPMDKPLPVIVSSIEMAEDYVEFSPRACALAAEHWPGALTMVLPIREFRISNLESRVNFQIPNSKFKIHILPNQMTLALRISSHPIAHALVEGLGRPISATSANISGEGNIYNPALLIQQFQGRPHQPDMLIDAGMLQPIPPSTIVEIVGDAVRVVRQGTIHINE